MRRAKVLAAPACALLLALAALGAHAQTLAIPGAGPPEALLRALAEEFGKRHAPARVEVPSSTGQSGALDAVRSGRSPLGRLPRRLTTEEEKSGLAQAVIAREAIVFATGADVAVSNVSRAQLAQIFSGQFTNWHALGGKPAPIRVCYREETEAVLRILRGQLSEFAALKFTPGGRQLNRDDETIEALERFGWGVSWASYGNARAGRGLRVLALDGVVPDAENLRSGRYPLYYEAVLIYRPAALNDLARRFLDFAASPEGRKAIEAAGALPVAGK